MIVALAQRELIRLERLSEQAGLDTRTVPLLNAYAAMSGGGLARDQLDAIVASGAPPSIADGDALRRSLNERGLLQDALLSAPRPDIVAAALTVLVFRDVARAMGDVPACVWLGLTLIPHDRALVPVERLMHDSETILAMTERAAVGLTSWLRTFVDAAVRRGDKPIVARFVGMSNEGATAGFNQALIAATEFLSTVADSDDEKAGHLNNLSNRLSDAGRHPEALAAVEEAVTIRRDLAAANPARYAPDLATSLGARGTILHSLGRLADAAASFEEGAAQVRPIAA